MSPFYLSRDQVRELDRRAIHEYGVPGVVLMENAGRGAAELLVNLSPPAPLPEAGRGEQDAQRLARFPPSPFRGGGARGGEVETGRPEDLSPPAPLPEAGRGERVLILCGPGNNGGDGFVIARHLQNRGLEVDVLLFGAVEKLTPDARVNAEIWQKCGPLWTASNSGPLDVDIRRIIDGAPGWIVDALFGTGLTRALGPPFDEVVAAVNARGRPVLAVDIPSGLDCDTGEPLGPTIRATHTATFVAQKKGFANPQAKQWLGEVHMIDIGAPKKLVDEYRISQD